MKPISVKLYTPTEYTKLIESRSVLNEDGMRVKESCTNTQGSSKKNRTISVVPSDTESIELITQHKKKFEDLKHLNVILTNTCNLSCSYCYEQHKKDYGRFTVDSLRRLYYFLCNINNLEGKLFQFFGGEPLIHKKLIMEFIREYQVELQKNSQSVRVSLITNGTLLTEEFIDEYFTHDFVNMSISLDTDDKAIDHRELAQQDIDRIIDLIGRIPSYHKDKKMVSIRCTISRETAPHLKVFAQRLYNKGARVMVIHPLTMSSGQGNVVWDKREWNELRNTITWLITNLDGFDIQFSEGVGSKHHGNCLVGSDMIAVDGSGDFAGCYFITNQKKAFNTAILGNIFDNVLYTNRYDTFQTEYNKMFDEEEQCKTCDLKGFCYQCPAGNLSTGTRMFRPDNMCKQIVSLFLELQTDNSRKVFKEKYMSIVEATLSTDPELSYRKMAAHLMYKKITGHHLPIGEIDDILDTCPSHQIILGRFNELVLAGATTLPPAREYLPAITNYPMNIRQLYIQLLDINNVPSELAKADQTPLTDERCSFYFALVHMLVLNSKGDTLQKSRKLTQL